MNSNFCEGAKRGNSDFMQSLDERGSNLFLDLCASVCFIFTINRAGGTIEGEEGRRQAATEVHGISGVPREMALGAPASIW